MKSVCRFVFSVCKLGNSHILTKMLFTAGEDEVMNSHRLSGAELGCFLHLNGEVQQPFLSFKEGNTL